MWYNDPLVLRDFAAAAVECGIAEIKEQVYEKPYKFDNEFKVWSDAGYPAPEDAEWDDFVNSLGLEDEPSS